MNSYSASDNTYDYSLFANTSSYSAAPYFLNKMNSAILKVATGNNQAKIEMKISPFALTYEEVNRLSSLSGTMIVLYISMGISFIPALITSFLAMEKETNIKHQ